MITDFIPNFHFRPQSQKLTAEWFSEANTYCWNNANNMSLLFGKNLKEIDEYATGNYSMKPYRAMFNSQRRKMEKAIQNGNSGDLQFFDGGTPADGFEQIPLINEKLNSAISIVDKIPLEATATANDQLAAQKKGGRPYVLKE